MKQAYLLFAAVIGIMCSCSTQQRYLKSVQYSYRNLPKQAADSAVIAHMEKVRTLDSLSSSYHRESFNQYLDATKALCEFTSNKEAFAIYENVKNGTAYKPSVYAYELDKAEDTKRKSMLRRNLKVVLLLQQDKKDLVSYGQVPYLFNTRGSARTPPGGMYVPNSLFNFSGIFINAMDTSGYSLYDKAEVTLHEGKHMEDQKRFQTMWWSIMFGAEYATARMEIRAYKFTHSLFAQIGDTVFDKIFKEKVAHFDKIPIFNPNQIYDSDIDRMNALYNLFCEDINYFNFSVNAYFAYLESKYSKRLALKKEVAFAKVYLKGEHFMRFKHVVRGK